MKQHRRKITFLILAVFAMLFAFILAFRILPEFSEFWLSTVIQPITNELHRLSSKVDFPIVEIAAIGLAIALALRGVIALIHGLVRFRLEPVFAWVHGLLWSLLIIGGIYVLLWYPAYWAIPASASEIPSAMQLEWLADELIESLNASDLEFSSTETIVKRASKIAGFSKIALKPARYPEWMHALHISGIYAPWTGEAIIDPTSPRAALPFTAVHELMHLQSIADEGDANIAAWYLCMEAGGEFADSARLWALKYTRNALIEVDQDAWSRLHNKMEGTLSSTFHTMGGNATTRNQNSLFNALGLDDTTHSYERLVDHLAAIPFANPQD